MRHLHIASGVVVLGLGIAFPAPSGAQPPVSAGLVIDQPALQEFEPTPEGDWRTVVAAPNGTRHEYVFVPPTKVEPRIRVRVSAPQSGLPLTYRFTIANGAGARQELAVLFIGANQSARLTEAPVGWQQVLPQRPGNVSIHGPLLGEIPSGIRAGTETVVVMDAYDLPGVVTIRAMGNTAGAVTVPPGLNTRQYEELSRLSAANTTVNVPAIGPAIPLGIHEPELTFSTLLARVAMHYVGALNTYRHPHAEALTSTLTRAARDGAALSDTAVRAALNDVITITRRAAPDPFHEDISAALRICVETLLSGKLPLAEPDRVAIVQELRERLGPNPPQFGSPLR